MKTFSLLFGLVLGSFLNVCIHRIPLGKSIIYPPSSCPNCGKKIRFYDNVPIISYLALGGKCRSCRAPISLQYPVVEALTGLLTLALFSRYGLGLQFFLFLIFMAALVMVSFIDLQHQIIPDVISLPGILLGFSASLFAGPLSWFDSLIGIIGGGGFLFLVAVVFERLTGKEGMGGGDVKLLAMIGAWMGWKLLPFVILISSLAGTVLGGGALLIAGKGLRVRIPFGPFIALGALICFFFGYEIALWYQGIVF